MMAPTRAPAALGYTRSSSAPVLNGATKISIKRREFAGTITNGAVTGFAVTPLSLATPGYDINPSCSALFPWLSQVASAFERFRFNKLSFEFIPGQATSVAGRYYAAVDYDYDDQPATAKATLMGNQNATESPIWDRCVLKCDAGSLNRDLPYRFVSSTARTSFVDQRTAYSGFLMVGFDTLVANNLIDLWVEYEVELVTPVIDDEVSQILPVYSYTTPAANVVAATGTGFLGVVPHSLASQPRGVVSLVTSGGLGVPNFYFTYGGVATAIPYALDIKGAKYDGLLSLDVLFNATGVTPATLLGAAVAPEVIVGAYDSTGSYLGLANALGWSSTIGLYAVSQLATASGYLEGVYNILMSNLSALYPTVRYLVPFLIAQSAVGAGNSGWGFTYQK